MSLKLTKRQNADLVTALLSSSDDEDRVKVYYQYGQEDHARKLQHEIWERTPRITGEQLMKDTIVQKSDGTWRIYR